MNKRYGAPVAGEEKEVLGGFLDHYRQTVLDICEGLSDEELRRPMVPSGTSLLGMVKHLAYDERGWFQESVANEPFDYPFDTSDPDADLRVEEGETSEEIFQLYRDACDRSRRAGPGTATESPAYDVRQGQPAPSQARARARRRVRPGTFGSLDGCSSPSRLCNCQGSRSRS